MSWDTPTIALEAEEHFTYANGLWKGKKPPYATAGVIRNTNFNSRGTIDESNIAWLEVEEKKLSSRRLQWGDVIVERSGGGPKQPVGRVVFFEIDDGRAYSFSNFTSVIRSLDHSVFDPRFMFYFMLFFYESGQTEPLQRRTTGIRNLDFTSYRQDIQVPQITQVEQQKIAYVLSVVQRAMEQQERLIQTTTELKKALMQKLFTEGTRGEPQKQTEIGPVPKSWDVKPLDGCISDTRYGISAKADPDGDTPMLRMTNQVNGRIVRNKLQYLTLDQEEIDKYKVEQNDIMFNRTNSFDLVGRTALFDLEGDYVFASYLIRVRTNSEILKPHFLNHYFNDHETQARLKTIATRAVSQSNISATRLRTFVVPLPKPKEQDAIVTKIDVVDQKIAVHQRKLNALNDLFKTLLHKLMTAEIRVHDIDLPGFAESIKQSADSLNGGQANAGE